MLAKKKTKENDKSVVVLYPFEKYSDEEILSVVKNKDFPTPTSVCFIKKL